MKMISIQIDTHAGEALKLSFGSNWNDGASVDVGRLKSLQARGSPSFLLCFSRVHIYTDLTLVRQESGTSLVKCLRLLTIRLVVWLVNRIWLELLYHC